MQRGVQYYVAGRHACLAQQFPVSANLLHHAVEMFAKGVLCRSRSMAELQAHRHNLKRIWKELCREFPNGHLGTFDGCVSSLQKFERLRYPDEQLQKGAVAQLVLFRGELVKQESFGAKPCPSFNLVLEEIDELVSNLFRVANVNPQFYLELTNPLAKAALDSKNLHRML